MASNRSLPTIEDFALLRSSGAPTYHLASCADDVDLRISHIVRGQDHLTNTFKHVLIFRAAGLEPPQFAHLPLAHCTRWQQAFQTPPRARRFRHHLARRRLSARSLREFPVPSRLVAQERSGANDARRAGRPSCRPSRCQRRKPRRWRRKVRGYAAPRARAEGRPRSPWRTSRRNYSWRRSKRHSRRNGAHHAIQSSARQAQSAMLNFAGCCSFVLQNLEEP